MVRWTRTHLQFKDFTLVKSNPCGNIKKIARIGIDVVVELVETTETTTVRRITIGFALHERKSPSFDAFCETKIDARWRQNQNLLATATEGCDRLTIFPKFCCFFARQKMRAHWRTKQNLLATEGCDLSLSKPPKQQQSAELQADPHCKTSWLPHGFEPTNVVFLNLVEVNSKCLTQKYQFKDFTLVKSNPCGNIKNQRLSFGTVFVFANFWLFHSKDCLRFMQTSGTILVHAEFLLFRSKDYGCSSNVAGTIFFHANF